MSFSIIPNPPVRNRCMSLRWMAGPVRAIIIGVRWGGQDAAASRKIWSKLGGADVQEITNDALAAFIIPKKMFSARLSIAGWQVGSCTRKSPNHNGWMKCPSL